MSETMNITEAASFLGLHVETLRQRAAAGVIPGAKIGRSWRFVKQDLLDHLRKKYRGQSCCTSEKTPGTSTFKDRSLDRWAELGAQLRPKTERPRRSCTTS